MPSSAPTRANDIRPPESAASEGPRRTLGLLSPAGRTTAVSPTHGTSTLNRLRFLVLGLTLLGGLLLGGGARAVEAVRVQPDAPAIDLLSRVEAYRSDGDLIQISTAPGPDGIVRRMAIMAKEPGTRPDWIVFALRNDGEETITRWLVAPHFRLLGSGVLWPDLGSTRISAVTASQGESPSREENAEADIFEITLEPGAIVTYVAELATPTLPPQLYLWNPDDYKERNNGLTLYRGIVIGISALLALFLTIVFVVRGAVIFPAAAALAWSVLAYVSIDFGFWHKLIATTPEAERVYRASSEAVLAATLLVFLFAYLNLNRWHVRYSHVTLGWLAFLGALIGLALVNPVLAAGIARVSIAAVAAVGFVLVVYLSTHGYDRALMLIPTWFMLLAWVVATGFALVGLLHGEIAAPALVGGLVLIVMLIGFTVMQHAFSRGVLSQGVVSDVERKALALAGSGDTVFDWDVLADRLHVGPEIEVLLNHPDGTLTGPAATLLDLIHPFDRDRFRAGLDAALEQGRGRLQFDFRLQARDGNHLWFSLKARPLVADDGEVVRIVGSIAEVTGAKLAEQRILKDAVHDHLTSLPNRRLFLDRVETSLALARGGEQIRSTILVIDMDRFRSLNESLGIAGGDTMLLTMARRISRLLRPQDTLARISGDQFAILLLSERDPAPITAFSDAVRSTIGAPVIFGDKSISLTASIGIALPDPMSETRGEDLLRNAEIAMTHAKRLGGDRIDVFRPAMRAHRTDRLALETDLRRAIEKSEVRVVFQPIVRMDDRAVVGFEALARWDHPKYGSLSPREFIGIAEESGLIGDLGRLVLDRAVFELQAWQDALEVDPPIFVNVNVSARQLIDNDLAQDVKAALSRYSVRRGSLRLEITESSVMENPEYAAQMLAVIAESGVDLVLDDFGTGFSSLSHLQRFPFRMIKIDRSLVRAADGGARPLVLRSIIRLAHDLGMEVVAEGLESENDVIELAELACEFGQGYVFGKPMSAAETRKLLGAAASSEAA